MALLCFLRFSNMVGANNFIMWPPTVGLLDSPRVMGYRWHVTLPISHIYGIKIRPTTPPSSSRSTRLVRLYLFALDRVLVLVVAQCDIVPPFVNTNDHPS